MLEWCVEYPTNIHSLHLGSHLGIFWTIWRLTSKMHAGNPNARILDKSKSISFPESFYMGHLPSSSKVKWFGIQASHDKSIGQNPLKVSSSHFLPSCGSIVLDFLVSGRLERSEIPFWRCTPTPQNSMIWLLSFVFSMSALSDHLPFPVLCFYTVFPFS